jgi:hypothetical protein
MKRITICIMLLFFVGLLPMNVQAEEKTVNLMSAPFGTGSYVLGSALEEISKTRHPWLRISHSESPGLVFSIKKLGKEPESRKTTIVSSTIGVNWLAQKGMQPFDQKYEGLMLLANYNLVSVWLATLKSEIKTVPDLAGKKLALGRTTQISWAVEPEMILRIGWDMQDKVNLQYVGTKPAVAALTDGLVDAAVIGGYLDPINNKMALSPQTVELMASGRNLYHIPWGEEQVKKTARQGIPITAVTIPANVIEGLDKPLSSFTDSVAWCAAKEFPENLAYEITKLIITNCGEFSEYHNLGKLMSPKALPFGWAADRIHPGALRAYKEAGIID